MCAEGDVCLLYLDGRAGWRGWTASEGGGLRSAPLVAATVRRGEAHCQSAEAIRGCGLLVPRSEPKMSRGKMSA